MTPSDEIVARTLDKVATAVRYCINVPSRELIADQFVRYLFEEAKALRTPKPTPTQPGTVELYSPVGDPHPKFGWPAGYERNTAAERLVEIAREIAANEPGRYAFLDAAVAEFDRGGST